MNIINLTPHSVEVYAPTQFVNLEQVNPTTWVADGVEGEPIGQYPSQGSARIETKTQEIPGFEIPFVCTQYGAATGIPENVDEDDILIVSLPFKSMAVAANHSLISQMVSPYKVVRSRSNGSLVLGCMGFTF